MDDINSVVIVGRLARDIESRDFTNSSKQSFSVAVNKSIKKDNGYVDDPNFFEVEVWNNAWLTKYASKGSRVCVSGQLAQSSWEKDGQRHSKVFIRADRVQLLDSRNSDRSEAPKTNTYTPPQEKKVVTPETFDDDPLNIPF